jgi:beta-lactamase class A
MAADLKFVLFGNVLSRPSRNQVTLWMEANVTGLERLRAKLPAGWRAADKTGSNGEHTSNDIAVLWPSGKPPIIVTAYITQCTGPESKRGAMLAEVGELAREALL